MPSSTAQRTPWTDKFTRPSVDDLRGQFAKPIASLLDATREMILEPGNLDESVEWQGVPWRWTLVYAERQPVSRNRPTPTQAWAYLIADPTRLQVCVPLTGMMLGAMPVKRFKKWVRDGIVFARSVGGVCWPTWEITSREQFEDIAEVVRRKQRLATGPLPETVSA